MRAIFFLLTALFSSAFAQTQLLLIDANSVTAQAAADWKKEGFKGIALVLDESTGDGIYQRAAKAVIDAKLDLAYWIEVGRNKAMADKNPRWMAALGSHKDWMVNFPNFPEPAIGEVAKAYPWVPIRYAETFDAHLARIDQLLKRAPAGWTTLLLNNLQGGPSSCGCGNLQCRWALDYHVTSTATKLEGDDVPARFLNEVRKRAEGKQVVAVWTTECSEADLPAKYNAGKAPTGYCGSVPCAHSACEEVFASQWRALTSSNSAPVAILGAHTALQRHDPKFGGGPGWVTNSVAHLNQTLKLRSVDAFPSDRLWVVVEDAQQSRNAAKASGAAGIVVARVKIDQSYEPRMIKK